MHVVRHLRMVCDVLLRRGSKGRSRQRHARERGKDPSHGHHGCSSSF
jgi:hypothetical protein